MVRLDAIAIAIKKKTSPSAYDKKRRMLPVAWQSQIETASPQDENDQNDLPYN